MANFLKTKHFVYLTLFLLTVVSVNLFSIFSALGSGNASSSSRTTSQHLSASNIVEIKKVVLLDAERQNWKHRVTIEAIVDDYAIVMVYDNYTGGESILEKKQDGWEIICGMGGAFNNQVEQLVKACKMSRSAATHLLQERQHNRDQGFDNLNN